MLCPVCAVELTMADRQGIEIDYCSLTNRPVLGSM